MLYLNLSLNEIHDFTSPLKCVCIGTPMFALFSLSCTYVFEILIDIFAFQILTCMNFV